MVCEQWPREAARAMATKMAGRLTTQERAQIASRYEVWNSVVAVQRWWCTMKGGHATVRQETIKNCHSKLLTTGSVKDALWSGRQSTSWSEENVALVRGMFIHSPRIWLGKDRWSCFHAQWRTATLCTERTFLVGSEVSGTWLGRRGPHEWPARSPDFMPCEFFSVGKGEVYRAKPRTMEQLEDRIRNVITNVPHDFLQETVGSIPGRLWKLVNAASAYIELYSMRTYFHLKRYMWKLFSLSLHWKYRSFDHFLMPTCFPPTL
jgi:hypothetical protein